MNKGCCFKKILFFFFLFVGVTTLAQNSTQKPVVPKQYIESLMQYYSNMCKEVNKQLPIEIDEITTLKTIIFFNWTITATYTINLDFKYFTKDECKEMMEDIRKSNLENAKRMMMFKDDVAQSEIKEAVKITGLKMQQTYYDKNGLYIGSNVYGYKDLFGSK